MAEIASRSHGVVTRRGLLAAGFSVGEIRRRIERGTLVTVHRGVYRVGHSAPSREAAFLAAVEACGPGSLLAGRAAGHLWSLIKGRPPPPEIISPTTRTMPGITVHRARIAPEEGRRLGIPVTSVPRTLVDLAASLAPSPLARVCHEAGVLYGVTPGQVEAVLARRPNAPGAKALRRVMHGDEPVLLSRLEARFLARIKEAGLPLPETNRPAGGHRVDCRWPEQRLTVELDSYRFHSSRQSWERDRQREREARARGDEFRRYTWADVSDGSRAMVRDLRDLLSGGGAGRAAA